MSAPVLYIIIPLILGILLFLLRKRKRLVQGVGITSSLILGLLGFTLPLGAVISAGDSTLKIPSSLAILGRSLTILDSDRPIVGIIFVFSAMWFIAARIDQDRSNIIAIGMMISGLLVASMAIVPFLYAALIQALIALLGIGILTNRGRKVGTGTLRYLVFQMLGVPFILLTGWVLTVAGVNPSDEVVLFQAVLFILLGFAFWLGIFPFDSWIPMLANEGDTIAVGFMFSILPSINMLMLLDYLNSYAWLRESSVIFQAFSVCGTIMAVSGGIWAVFQKNIKKLFGHAVIIDTGLTLIAFSLNSRLGFEYVVQSIIPRTLAYLLITVAISRIITKSNLETKDVVEGIWARTPWTTIALLIGMFSLVGIPLLGSFPIKLALVIELFKLPAVSLPGVGIGIVGLLIACLRLAQRTKKETTLGREPEPRAYIIFLISVIVILVTVGLFPSLFYQNITNIMKSYPYLN